VSISWPTPSPISVGTKLGNEQLNAIASVGGVFTYDPQLGSVLAPGTYKLTVHFAPDDPGKFKDAYASTILVVIPTGNVTPAPTSNRLTRSYLEYEGSPLFTGESPAHAENVAFSIGDLLAFNVHFRATGPNPVKVSNSEMATEVVNNALAGNQSFDQKVIDAGVEEFMLEINKEGQKIKGTPSSSFTTMMPGDRLFNTAFSWTDRTHRSVTRQDLDGIRNGTETWLVMSIITYYDGRAIHHLRRCTWLSAPGEPQSVWHLCGGKFPDSD
jgi:hypothetical protein